MPRSQCMQTKQTKSQTLGSVVTPWHTSISNMVVRSLVGSLLVLASSLVCFVISRYSAEPNGYHVLVDDPVDWWGYDQYYFEADRCSFAAAAGLIKTLTTKSSR